MNVSAKKVLVIMSIVMIILVLVLYILSRIYMQRTTVKPAVPTPSVAVPTSMIIEPSPTWVPLSDIDPTVAAIPIQQTGGEVKISLTTREQAFSDLSFKIPLDFTDFTVGFDYAEDKFSILIFSDQGMEKYTKWRKDAVPSMTDDQFIVTDKRM